MTGGASRPIKKLLEIWDSFFNGAVGRVEGDKGGRRRQKGAS